ncbi:hypothetical protein E2C01_026596 [Portunus trituberculatus]|uniref:Uncharacterized protein n=1 Tax=Portunus trituberculatus TaxID=210409 RepID=A0A5B7EGI7_PORTR|nr:hypothetical protein [Portunus trituberculatus]
MQSHTTANAAITTATPVNKNVLFLVGFGCDMKNCYIATMALFVQERRAKAGAVVRLKITYC